MPIFFFQEIDMCTVPLVTSEISTLLFQVDREVTTLQLMLAEKESYIEELKCEVCEFDFF